MLVRWRRTMPRAIECLSRSFDCFRSRPYLWKVRFYAAHQNKYTTYYPAPHCRAFPPACYWWWLDDGDMWWLLLFIKRNTIGAVVSCRSQKNGNRNEMDARRQGKRERTFKSWKGIVTKKVKKKTKTTNTILIIRKHLHSIQEEAAVGMRECPPARAATVCSDV